VLETTRRLEAADVQLVVAHAVEQASRSNESVVVAVCDRYGAVLGVFRMTGSPGSTQDAVTKARTAAYLSSQQHGFTSLTACYITRPHFPPGITNVPGGPLFGVGLSSLPGGDIQPNGSSLTGAPGGVPLFEDGDLVGGVGISGASAPAEFDVPSCGGQLADERIALGATGEFTVPPDERGDNIFLDGVRLLYSNSDTPPGDYQLAYAEVFPALGAEETAITSAAATPLIPFEGEVVLDGMAATHDFSIRAGSFLSESDVRGIIRRAADQAARTRAAIRRPIGSPAAVFISVVDLDGSALGIWRTPDATVFSFDVCVQKARTALAFSQPSHALGQRIRQVLGISPAVPIAVTTRALGFLSQDFFPPGIDDEVLGVPVQPGPFFGIQEEILASTDPLGPYGNGLTIFPGGIPLFSGDLIVGAIGVSGDGVDQDDLIAFAGARGFLPDAAIRSDAFFYDGVRLPFVKFPRQPELE
jgi:uncharacterized protein GlcG (DUF336 family)